MYNKNIYVRMFYFDFKMENKKRTYKYGIEIRTFQERMYIAIVIPADSKSGEETFFFTKNPQLLPYALGSNKIDLGKFYGCGDLKALYQRSNGQL